MAAGQSGYRSIRTQEFIIQPTSFCNINCDYCYLPHRSVQRRMSRETLACVMQAIFSSSLVGEHVRIVWHAGEPLMMPVSFYEEAFRLVAQYNRRAVRVTFVFQTNGTSITSRWHDFIKAHDVHISISLDGPQHVHDAHRVGRAGQGTFASIMRNIERLQANGIPLTILLVLTRESLAYPDDIWRFLLEHGIESVSFLPEEALGEVQEVPLSTQEDLERYRAFLQRILALRETTQHRIFIGGIDEFAERIIDSAYQVYSQANTPLAIVSFDCDGNISTLSPELLTLSHARYSNFLFGNVFQHRLEDMLSHPTFQQVNAEVRRGVALCRDQCDYFIFCGGGSPVNKLSETGTFAVSETVFCRLKIQATTEVVLQHLWRQCLRDSS